MQPFAKTALPLLAAFALTLGVASAQTTPAPAAPAPAQGRPMPSPQQMAEHQTKRLTKELGLSVDQAAKVQQILQQRDQEMLAMRSQAQPGADRQQMHQQLEANRAKYDEQLKAVFTPDQFSKYTTMRAEHGHHGHHGRPGGKEGKLKIKDGDQKIKEKAS